MRPQSLQGRRMVLVKLILLLSVFIQQSDRWGSEGKHLRLQTEAGSVSLSLPPSLSLSLSLPLSFSSLLYLPLSPLPLSLYLSLSLSFYLPPSLSLSSSLFHSTASIISAPLPLKGLGPDSLLPSASTYPRDGHLHQLHTFGWGTHVWNIKHCVNNMLQIAANWLGSTDVTQTKTQSWIVT